MSRKLTASDRSRLIRLASTMEKGSPERKAILAGLKTALKQSDVSMGIVRDGEEVFWPAPPTAWDWALPHSWIKTRFGDYTKVTYGWDGDGYLFVDFDANPYLLSGGDKPGTYEARVMGYTHKGVWKSPRDILKVLDAMKKENDSLVKQLRQEVSALGGADWEVDYDGFQANAYLRHDALDIYLKGDPLMSVTFYQPEEAVQGDASRADIRYEAGNDYQGAYGVKEYSRSYSSVKDMKKILDEAKRNFYKLNK